MKIRIKNVKEQLVILEHPRDRIDQLDEFGKGTVLNTLHFARSSSEGNYVHQRNWDVNGLEEGGKDWDT